MKRTVTHFGTYDVRVEGDLPVALDPVSADPAPNGLAEGLLEVREGPLRITAPMVRRGWLEDGPGPAGGARGSEPFVEVSWDRALDLVATELARVRRTHGDEAVYGGSYGWGSPGRFHHAQSQIHRFLTQGGGYTASVGSYSAGAMEAVLPHVIGGDPWSFAERGVQWPEIVERGELVVSFGGTAPKNAFANAGGVGRHAQPSWQRGARAAGVEFVSVSPLRGDADPALDADWIAPRPGTDVALMLGLAHELVRTRRHDEDFLARCCVGWEPFERYLLGREDGVAKSAAWAATVCGIEPMTIVDLADRIARSRTTINVTWSLQRMQHGEQAHWMGVVLAAMSGSMGRVGGGYAGGLGISLMGVRPRRHRIASLPQGTNPVGPPLPVARIADALLGPGTAYDFDGTRATYPDLRLVYWAGGNPFHHHQDLHRLVRAWQRPDTVVVHEAHWNPLARFSDIVLPVATTLERDDLAAGMMDLTITAMSRVADPPAGVRTDYEVFAALADRLGFGGTFTEGRSAEEWVRELYARTVATLAEDGVPLPSYDELRELGSVETPEPEPDERWSFARLREDPASYPVPTPSGRIEITSATIASFGYDDCGAHPRWYEPAEWLGSADRFPLALVSNQPSRRLHSQLDHASHSRAGKVAGREPVTLHPDDAAARGIGDGDVVRIHNDRGACLAGAVLSADVRPGVVVLATGAWFDPETPGVAGSLDRHGNPNVLTADRGASSLSQGPSPGTTLVEVTPYDGVPPAVRCFEPPEIL